ncbi:hypothetical protein PanWU01x14_359990 [Parasponia andersonii]|uniref:Transmembrane protein n=1 Tax=Parasponia andersonii TaxID=3476 RepID=A0A2P5A7S1_PARAD|nr:hypothetical protein PanWU01x14_359990 [Parasponia andersonii]
MGVPTFTFLFLPFTLIYHSLSFLLFFFPLLEYYLAASYSSRGWIGFTPSRYPLRHFPNFQGKEKAGITAIGF